MLLIDLFGYQDIVDISPYGAAAALGYINHDIMRELVGLDMGVINEYCFLIGGVVYLYHPDVNSISFYARRQRNYYCNLAADLLEVLARCHLQM